MEVAAWRLLWALELWAVGVAASLLWVVGVLWVLWVGQSRRLAQVAIGPPMAGQAGRQAHLAVDVWVVGAGCESHLVLVVSVLGPCGQGQLGVPRYQRCELVPATGHGPSHCQHSLKQLLIS